jgi:hypothetical protein
MVAIVDHRLHRPIGRQPGLGGGGPVGQVRCAARPADGLQVNLGGAGGRDAIGLVRARGVDAGAVLADIVEDHQIAASIPAAADMPGENMGRIGGIGHAAGRVIAVKRRDIVAADAAPMAEAGRDFGPALDPGVKLLNAGPVKVDQVGRAPYGAAEALPLALRVQHGNEVLRAGKNEHIRFAAIVVARQALVGFASDRWRVEAPAETEGAIARARAVAERQLRPEAAAPRAQRHRDCGAGRAVGGADRHLLPHPAQGAASLGKGNRRKRAGCRCVGWWRVGSRGCASALRGAARRRPLLLRGPEVYRPHAAPFTTTVCIHGPMPSSPILRAC